MSVSDDTSRIAKVGEETMDNEEHMLSPVPHLDKRSTIGLAAVWVGFGFVVTGLIVGGQLAGQGGAPGMSFAPAMLTITIGELILFALTVLIGIPAMKTGYNLSLLAKASYGTKGFILPMFVMALLTLGWFASILGMIGDIWGSLLGNPSGVTLIPAGVFGLENAGGMTLEVVLSCLVFGALFTYTAYKGISAIEKVATAVAPCVLIVALGVGIAMVVENGGWTNMLETASTKSGMSMGTGLTIIIGAWIAGAIMGADIMRFARSTKAVWTTSLWTTNNSELYSNSLYAGPSLNAVNVKVKRTTLVLIAGVIGTILGSLGFYQLFFAEFITILGAAFVPLAAPIIVDFFIVKKQKYAPNEYLNQPAIKWPGFLSFIIGACSGLFFQYGVPLPGGFSSGIAALLIAIVAHIILVKILPVQRVEQSA